MDRERMGIPRRLLLTGDAAGEPWSMTVELARALAGAGTEIHLATMGEPLSAEDHETIGSIPGISLYESSFKLDWMDEPWRDINRAGEWLLRLESRLHPDVVHLNHPVYGALPWRNPAVVTVHGCMLSRWLAVRGQAAPAAWDAYRRATAAGLQGARRIAAPSQSLLHMLELFYGPLARSRVIPYGRAASEFQPDSKQPFILCIGGLSDDALNIGALHQVAAELNWPVYVAGASELKQGRKLPPGGAMFLGRLSSRERRFWLARTSIFVLPAFYEPFGIPVLEAALSGCALVLGDIPSLSEVWGDAALYVPAGDPHALRGALRRLTQDASLRRRMGARARERALPLTARRMIAGYRDLYREVAYRPAAEAQAVVSGD